MTDERSVPPWCEGLLNSAIPSIGYPMASIGQALFSVDLFRHNALAISRKQAKPASTLSMISAAN